MAATQFCFAAKARETNKAARTIRRLLLGFSMVTTANPEKKIANMSGCMYTAHSKKMGSKRIRHTISREKTWVLELP